MKLIVFGATGATGSRLVERAVAAGHAVVAVARDPARVAPRAGLTVRAADVLDPAAVAAAVAGGADAVVSCIGPTRNRRPGTVVSAGVAHLVAACRAAGVRRLVMQSGILMTDGRELSAANRLAVRVLRRALAAAVADKAAAEQTLRDSLLDWVIVRPVGLTNRPLRGTYTAGPAARVRPFRLLPFADCADCLLRAATDPAWTRQTVNLGR